jgi:hypothetical protein
MAIHRSVHVGFSGCGEVAHFYLLPYKFSVLVAA